MSKNDRLPQNRDCKHKEPEENFGSPWYWYFNGLSFFEYLIWDDIVIVKIRPTSIIPFSLVVTCARSSPENLRKISTTRFTRMHVSTLQLLVYMIVVKTIWQIIFHSYQFINFIPWTKIRQTSCHQMSPTSVPCEGSLQRGGLFFRAEETEGYPWEPVHQAQDDFRVPHEVLCKTGMGTMESGEWIGGPVLLETGTQRH